MTDSADALKKKKDLSVKKLTKYQAFLATAKLKKKSKASGKASPASPKAAATVVPDAEVIVVDRGAPVDGGRSSAKGKGKKGKEKGDKGKGKEKGKSKKGGKTKGS